MSALLRMVVWTLALALAVLPVVAVLNGWFAAERWPIERLVVQADYQRVGELAIRDAVAPHAAAGFFAVDLDQVRAAVAALDWVAEVEVRKRWPNRLDLLVREHEPFARLGDTHLVSALGRVFELPGSGAPEGLPRFEASAERLPELIQVFSQAQPLFALHGGQLVALRLSPRGSWTFRLADGASLMAGRGDPVPRLQRYLPLLVEVVRADGRPLLRGDLRYGNGFALRWDEATALPATHTSNNGTGT